MRADWDGTVGGRSEEGWTLMELIVVLVILGMLAAVVGPKVYDKIIQSKDQIAKIQIGELEGALQLYSFDLGRFPSTAEGLQALVQNPTGADSWKGPYLKKGVPADPWERPYAYKSPGDHSDFDLFSFGADGDEGTEDDICNWE
ncbi:MAG: type II secretion system major pseudopilin GspG [Acidobacteriota bacterium]|jgi:general secretion pathway protein G|nr:type II secretion system major pseudopilin GspG [Acidobacteriota bacterium]